MARAVRYQLGRISSRISAAREESPKMHDPEAKARAIASEAARKAARKVDPRVRKSAAKRTEGAIVGRIKQLVLETGEDLRMVAKTAKRALKRVKTPVVGVRTSTVLIAEKAHRKMAR